MLVRVDAGWRCGAGLGDKQLWPQRELEGLCGGAGGRWRWALSPEKDPLIQDPRSFVAVRDCYFGRKVSDEFSNKYIES